MAKQLPPTTHSSGDLASLAYSMSDRRMPPPIDDLTIKDHIFMAALTGMIMRRDGSMDNEVVRRSWAIANEAMRQRQP